jgi:hypothetical protein
MDGKKDAALHRNTIRSEKLEGMATGKGGK